MKVVRPRNSDLIKEDDEWLVISRLGNSDWVGMYSIDSSWEGESYKVRIACEVPFCIQSQHIRLRDVEWIKKGKYEEFGIRASVGNRSCLYHIQADSVDSAQEFLSSYFESKGRFDINLGYVGTFPKPVHIIKALESIYSEVRHGW